MGAKIGNQNAKGMKPNVTSIKKGEHKGIKTEFQKGCTPWNKGKKYLAISGEKHFNWKGGITSFEYKERRKFQHGMQKKVFERDNYICQICGKRGGDLQVDHIQSWAEYVKLRFCMDNCRTVCKSCHYQITYGRPIPDEKMEWGHNLGRVRIVS